jgi:nitroreductase
MELYDVMRTTFAVREFTDDPLPDPVLYRILDNARFAPSGATDRQRTSPSCGTPLCANDLAS